MASSKAYVNHDATSDHATQVIDLIAFEEGAKTLRLQLPLHIIMELKYHKFSNVYHATKIKES